MTDKEFKTYWTELPEFGILEARLSDNVLDESDWPIVRFSVSAGAIRDAVVVKEGVYSLIDEIRNMKTTADVCRWTQHDSTGRHPENYNEIRIIESYSGEQRQDVMWGRTPTGPYAAYWGARAIYNEDRAYGFTLLPDRQSWDGDEAARNVLARWLRDCGVRGGLGGLKRIRALVKRHRLPEKSDEVLTLDDGPVHVEATPNGSYGYLYIGAELRQ